MQPPLFRVHAILHTSNIFNRVAVRPMVSALWTCDVIFHKVQLRQLCSFPLMSTRFSFGLCCSIHL